MAASKRFTIQMDGVYAFSECKLQHQAAALSHHRSGVIRELESCGDKKIVHEI